MRPESGQAARAHQVPQHGNRTCDAAEQAQIGGGVPLVAVGHAFSRRRGHRNGHRDRFMELPSSWFHGDDWAKRGFVSKGLFHNFIGNRLRLKTEEGPQMDVNIFLSLENGLLK